jgi:uncharacterized protein
VILNLLSSVHSADSSLSVAHQCSGDLPNFVQKLKDKNHSLKALNAGAVVGGTAWLWSNAAMEQQLDYLFIDEAGQMSLAMALAASRAAKNVILLGDPQQLEQPQQGIHPEGADKAVLCHILDGADTMPENKGLFLKKTWRLHPAICEFTSEQYYDGRLVSSDGLHNQCVYGSSQFVGYGLRFVNVDHRGNQNRSDEEVAKIRQIVDQLTDGSHEWSTKDNIRLPITLKDILIVAPYNAQVNALIAALPPAARVGTVDKFQGQEAPVVIYSMTSSSVTEAPRGPTFLLSPNRMNVATSRARCLVLMVGSAELFAASCETPDQMRMLNGLCRFREMASIHDKTASMAIS